MDFQVPSINLIVIAPVLIVLLGAVLAMLVDFIAEVVADSGRFHGRYKTGWAPWVAMLTLVVALVQTVGMWGYSAGTFTPVGGTPMVVVDNYATFLNIILLLTGILTIFIAVSFLRRFDLNKPEFYMLMLLSLGGMMLMGMGNDLILIFLALEILSIPLYILSGFAWPRPESEESAMKYFVLGAFSSAIFIFGIAIMYGATGSTALPVIYETIDVTSPLALTATALLLVGFGFKIGAAPFHMWMPDVYEGAPTAVTAFMSVGAKVAGFAALMRVLSMALPEMSGVWITAVAVISALTLLIGNTVAIAQQNIKRMLAYSSIAHAGFILIGVAASGDSPAGVSSALFYMFAYLFTNLGAFAVVIVLEHKQNEGTLLNDYKGLAKRNPGLALGMAIMMLSLAGIPPTGGFIGKFYIFGAALDAGLGWLALWGVMTSVVSAFYYLRVVYLMYMFDGAGALVFERGLKVVLLVTAVVTFGLGLFPAIWLDYASQATLTTFQTFAGG